MIIDNFNIKNFPIVPHETDSPLTINTNTLLTFSISFQHFKVISGRHPEILKGPGAV